MKYILFSTPCNVRLLETRKFILKLMLPSIFIDRDEDGAAVGVSAQTGFIVTSSDYATTSYFSILGFGLEFVVMHIYENNRS